MPIAIRASFVIILIYGKILQTHAQELWQKFYPSMFEDGRHRHEQEKALHLTYVDVDKRLQVFHSSL